MSLCRLPGAGSANGVGSSGVVPPSPSAGVGGVLRTSLGMCNLSGESAIKIFFWMQHITKRKKVSQAVATWPAIRGRFSVPILPRRGGKWTESQGESSVQCKGMTCFLLGNAVLASPQPTWVQLCRKPAYPACRRGPRSLVNTK